MQVVEVILLMAHMLVSNVYLIRMKGCLFHKARPQLCTFPGLEFILVNKNSVSPQM